MKYSPKIFTTKSGHSYTIREVQLSDSESLQKCVLSYLRNNTIPLTAEEYQDLCKTHEAWLSQFIDPNSTSICLVAEKDGEIIGNIDLAMNARKIQAHTGYIGMGVHSNFQGEGIGSTLLNEVLKYADSTPSIEHTWLQVYANNDAGLKMYKKNGFEITGTQKNFFKLEDGRYVDNIIMTR